MVSTQTPQTPIINQTPQNSTELVIKVHGERLNSPLAERRMLFIETMPRIGIGELIHMLETTASWLKSKFMQFPTTKWWITAMECKYCAVVRTINLYKITELNEWKEAHCLRHAVAQFPLIAPIIDNKLRAIRISSRRTIYFTQSQKYTAVYDIDDSQVVAYWRKYNSSEVIRFTYRNHANSSPYLSTYAYIALAVHYNVVNLLAQLVKPDYNLYYNGELVKSP